MRLKKLTKDMESIKKTMYEQYWNVNRQPEKKDKKEILEMRSTRDEVKDWLELSRQKNQQA